MSSFDFTDGDKWNGRTVGRKIADVEPRAKLVVTGLVLHQCTKRVGGSLSGLYVLDDGTGQVDLVFLGRPSVAGLEVGACVTIEGTVRSESDRLVVWNPVYRLEPTFDD
jgi:RecG-like helicase